MICENCNIEHDEKYASGKKQRLPEFNYLKTTKERLNGSVAKR